MQALPRLIRSVFLLAAFGLSACGGSHPGPDGGGGGTCPSGAYSCNQRCTSSSPPSTCGQGCSVATPCPRTFHCGTGGTCESDCARGGDVFCPNGPCSSGGECSAPTNSGAPKDASVDACASVEVGAKAVTPNVILIIDESASMAEEYDTSDGIQCGGCLGNPNGTHSCYVCGNDPSLSRWDSLRAALVGTRGSDVDVGLVGRLQTQVRFGAVTFTSTPTTCPRISILTPSASDPSLVGVVDVTDPAGARSIIANGASGYFALSPAWYTPTGKAVQFTLDHLDPDLTAGGAPILFILATDGNPLTPYTDRCALDGLGDLRSAILGIQDAYAAGVPTDVLAVADVADISQRNVDEMANAGAGLPMNTSPAAASWRITDVVALDTALQEIIQGQIGCTVTLDGTVQYFMDGCAGGSVDFIDAMGARTPVSCDPTDGWTLTSATTIELHGPACTRLSTAPGVTLSATFPCHGVVLNPT